MSYPPPPPTSYPLPPPTPKTPLNTWLIVLFSLLMCCGLPILPIYLWRKGRLPAWAGIGCAVAWVVLLITLVAVTPAPEESTNPDNDAAPSDPAASAPESASSTQEPSSSASPTENVSREQRELEQRAEELVLAELPDIPLWDGTTAQGNYVSDTEVCVDRTYGPDGGVGGTGGNAGYVVVTFPDETFGEPQDGKCKNAEPSTPADPVDVPDELQDEPGLMTRDQYGADWPLTVDYGVVSCEDVSSVIFTDPDETEYAVNGTARSQTDLPDIDPIWADDPDLDGARIDISPIIDRGLDLCE